MYGAWRGKARERGLKRNVEKRREENNVQQVREINT
jgi:hypothetical protein